MIGKKITKQILPPPQRPEREREIMSNKVDKQLWDNVIKIMSG